MHQSDLYQQYDQVLVDLCRLVIDKQTENPDRYGMVAAAIVDSDGNIASSTNYFMSNGKRIHAERAAAYAYIREFGTIPKNAIVVTTLSPCCNPMEDRMGPSCADFISGHGIQTVYYGYEDPTQESHNEPYDSICTNNSSIVDLCKSFADTFLHSY